MNDLKVVVLALPIPVIGIDARRRVTVINPPGEILLGGNLEGRHIATVLRQPAIQDAVDGVLAGAKKSEASFQQIENGVQTNWRVSVAAAPVGGPGGAILAFEDETPSLTAGAMRRDFVANVSHELKTPLTAIIGFIETLQGPARDDPDARDRFLATMAREASRMNRLTHDLLSLSRVEQEERKRPSTLVSLVEVAQAAVTVMEPTAEGNRVVLRTDFAGGLPPVRGDADQLAQVLSNLIENAIKYGGSGGSVDIALDRVGHDARLLGPAQRIAVRDTGEGIAPQHLARLTERFYRVDSHRSRAIGGTGLGLAIAKHIANRHRGRLDIQSKLGDGSSFSIVLPEA